MANGDEASALESTLTDRRELAFVRFVNSAVLSATQREDVSLPIQPIDMRYVVEAARWIYAKRHLMMRILTEDPEQFLWGD